MRSTSCFEREHSQATGAVVWKLESAPSYVARRLTSCMNVLLHSTFFATYAMPAGPHCLSLLAKQKISVMEAIMRRFSLAVTADHVVPACVAGSSRIRQWPRCSCSSGRPVCICAGTASQPKLWTLLTGLRNTRKAHYPRASTCAAAVRMPSATPWRIKAVFSHDVQATRYFYPLPAT